MVPDPDYYLKPNNWHNPTKAEISYDREPEYLSRATNRRTRTKRKVDPLLFVHPDNSENLP